MKTVTIKFTNEFLCELLHLPEGASIVGANVNAFDGMIIDFCVTDNDMPDDAYTIEYNSSFREPIDGEEIQVITAEYVTDGDN